MDVMIVACPSLAFAFMLLLISHVIITAFACLYCILFLYFLALSSLHPFNQMFLLLFHLLFITKYMFTHEPHPLCCSQSHEITRIIMRKNTCIPSSTRAGKVLG